MASETRERSSRCSVHICEEERSAPNARSDDRGYLRSAEPQEERQKCPMHNNHMFFSSPCPWHSYSSDSNASSSIRDRADNG
jgi:hypothetical protein